MIFAPTDLAYLSAATRFGLTLSFEIAAADGEVRERDRSRASGWCAAIASNTVAQPSSFVRAVNSATLSVGAYASMPAILRKSFTACDAFAALPPTPRMKRRPPAMRVAASIAAAFSMLATSNREMISVSFGEKLLRECFVRAHPRTAPCAAMNRAVSSSPAGEPIS